MNAEDGSILLLDMLGGHAGESSVKLRRQNEATGGTVMLNRHGQLCGRAQHVPKRLCVLKGFHTCGSRQSMTQSKDS